MLHLMVVILARPEILKTPLGERLRELRKQCGDPSRAELAARLGVSEKTIGNYERGDNEPPASILLIFQEQLGVSLHWLVTGEGDMFSTPTSVLNYAAEMQVDIMRLLTRLVVRLHHDVGIKLPAEEITAETTVLYNDLSRRVDNLADREEVEAVLPQLELRLRKRLAEAKSKPGSGKREAS